MAECPVCKAKDVHVNLQKCLDCGKVYCWACAGQRGYGGTVCPKCGSRNTGDYRKGLMGPDGESDPQPH